MKPMKKFILPPVVFAVLLLSAGIASAQSYAAEALEIENFVGRVEIKTIAGDRVRVGMDAGAGIRDLPQVNLDDGVVRIFYSKRTRVRQCNVRGFDGDGGYNRKKVTIQLKGARKHKLADYPVLHIGVPAGTDLYASGGVIFGSADDLGSVDMTIQSCGDFRMGNVAGDLSVNINGSGDFWAGAVDGGIQARINGSGDIVTKSAGADARLRINGSGDIEVGDVRSVNASINGSGDIEVAQANGEVDLRINGSGDIEVNGGTAIPLQATIRGSGDIAFEGHASGVKVFISGSGDIVVGSFDGELDTGGHRVEVEIKGGRLHVEG